MELRLPQHIGQDAQQEVIFVAETSVSHLLRPLASPSSSAVPYEGQQTKLPTESFDKEVMVDLPSLLRP